MGEQGVQEGHGEHAPLWVPVLRIGVTEVLLPARVSVLCDLIDYLPNTQILILFLTMLLTACYTGL
jgi:hypothetical protein